VRTALVLAAATALVVCGSSSPSGPTLGATTTPVTKPTCVYRANGALPDRSCTPGAVNLHVTQSNIHKTICVKGWTNTIRPPVTVTEPLKLQQMRLYGYAYGTSPRGYEEDHLIALELGGAPGSPKNLWPEPHNPTGGKGAYTKDGVENSLHAAVCAGKISLATARREIRTDWTKVTT
jgi:hypothetical protein